MKTQLYILLSLFLLDCFGCQNQTNSNYNKSISPTTFEFQHSQDTSKHKPDNLIIRHGISFGECTGYCWTEYYFHEWGIEKVRRGWASGGDSTNYPTKKEILKISPSDYNDLVNLFNSENFQKLQTTIGCPDCADGGAEWITIQNKMNPKTVTFEYGSDILSIKDFLKKIRDLTKKP